MTSKIDRLRMNAEAFAKIRETCKLKEITLYGLSENLKLNRTYLYNIGRGRMIDATIMRQVCDYLELDIQYFVDKCSIPEPEATIEAPMRKEWTLLYNGYSAPLIGIFLESDAERRGQILNDLEKLVEKYKQ
ncbi:MAG: helix-turn-helix transcriptional regulator [Nanoarchaeota archaeon]